MASQKNLSGRTAVALGWTVLRYGGDQFFGFIIFAALARSINPESFGVFIIGLAVAEVGRIIAQSGLVSGIMRADKITPALVDTIFWANLSVAIVIALVCWFLRNPIASLLGSSEAGTVVGVLAFLVPVIAAGSTHMSQNLRNFGHRALAIRSLLVGVLGGGLALAAAYAGWGVWALVVHRFASEAIGTLVAWFAFRWRPGSAFSWRVLREQWALGVGVAGSQLLLTLLFRVQDVIISRFMGVGSVGLFRVASKPVDVVTQGIINCYFAVAPATFARLKHDKKALQNGYLRVMEVTSILLFPTLAGLWALLEILVPLVFGPQWTQGVPVAAVMCIMAPAYALTMFGDPILNRLGKAGGIFQITLFQLVVTVSLSLLAAPYGLYWFAVGCAVRSYATFAFQLFILQRAAKINISSILYRMTPAAIAAVLMGLAVRKSLNAFPLLGAMLDISGSAGQILTVIALTAQGFAIYALLLLVLVGAQQRNKFIDLAKRQFGRFKNVA